MTDWRQLPMQTIDAIRWDECVAARDGEVFSEYWYWNAVCPSWQAMVKGDYEEVLAIPMERKWGIVPVMRTPLYVKWIEGNHLQLNKVVKSFLGFKRVHTLFETETSKPSVVQILQLTDQWVPNKELTKNVRKAEREHPELVRDVGWTEFRDFMRKHHPYAWPAVQQQRMESLHKASQEKLCGRIAGIKMNGRWAAMQFYILRRNKAYLIQNAVDKSMRGVEPMSFLLFTLFNDWKSQLSQVRINFMGSNNTGVARFNEKFGAQSLQYWEIR